MNYIDLITDTRQTFNKLIELLDMLNDDGAMEYDFLDTLQSLDIKIETIEKK